MNNKSIFSNKGDKNFIGHGTLFQGDVQTTFFDLHICLVNTLLVCIIQLNALWILTTSGKECNYVLRASKNSSYLTIFLINSVHIYGSKIIYYKKSFHN